jgi:alpha-beta hydrolase superfamily lysophospholipase
VGRKSFEFDTGLTPAERAWNLRRVKIPSLRPPLLAAILLLSVSCTHLFLFPDHQNYFPDAGQKILFEEGFIDTADGEHLNYWLLPAQTDKKKDEHPKGLVIQVHGNAQNLSSHVRSIGWLTAAGYNLAAFDYRGYGKSSGSRDPDGAYNDVITALDYFVNQKNPDHLPVYFYGQSLGGTLLLKAVSSHPGRWHPAMVIIESSFDSFTGIAREKLAYSWITWPFQWLAYLLVSDKLSLKDEELKTISPIPVYMFYSENDPIVPVNHGERIFKALNEPKRFYTYLEQAHIAAMWVQKGKYRDILVEAMGQAAPK